MIKIKHLKTGRIYDILGKGKMKVNGEWVDSYTYGGIDKTTGEYTYFTRDKENFENHFEYENEDNIWHDGLTCMPTIERTIYDPVVYLVGNYLYLRDIDHEYWIIEFIIKPGKPFKWAYSSDLIKNFKSKKLPKYISDWVQEHSSDLHLTI